MAPAVLIIGASHAGVQFAAALRELGHTGRITLVDAQSGPPCQRPPLSKAFMRDAVPEDALHLRGPHFFTSAEIDFRSAMPAAALDRQARHVQLGNGERIPYDVLMLATGARPRPWPQGTVPKGVFVLRTLADARLLRNAADHTAGPIVVVGGGYISLELAATWRRYAQRDVTVINSGPRLLFRSASPDLSAFVMARHHEHGVRVLSEQPATGLVANDDGAVQGVALADGRIVPAALVVLGTGAIPEQDLAEAAGLACDDGILVDDQCRTSDPAIFAAGDCTRHMTGFAGHRIRLECVQNAHDQARVAAAVIMGRDARYTQVPWFWSDQFDMKIQTVGIFDPSSTCVVRGNPAAGTCAFYHFGKAEILQCIETVNMPAEHMQARQALTSGILPIRDQVASPSFSLKAFLAEQRAGLMR
ncbi:NAD(P)/FAD-dependent oxidoreductase [Gluconacetobacter tumulicola]|uniref:FAD-dependent oxidoreductase n=1 Tax=Gluconacetobacter tumulicola TaxID=1017177 RepID=A0A7W4PBC1_9PROT|nr:FAD-dependent oxidoreductase [Gluconacetobacter tumulicola]MBB2180975.1 FAD-dependent oxidoreductase [Gluconacetobacter tumulicola]